MKKLMNLLMNLKILDWIYNRHGDMSIFFDIYLTTINIY